MKFALPRFKPPKIKIRLPKFKAPKFAWRKGRGAAVSPAAAPAAVKPGPARFAFRWPWRRKKAGAEAATDSAIVDLGGFEAAAAGAQEEPNPAPNPAPAEVAPPGKKSRKKIMLIAGAATLALVGLGAGGWFFVAPWLGLRAATGGTEQQAKADIDAKSDSAGKSENPGKAQEGAQEGTQVGAQDASKESAKESAKAGHQAKPEAEHGAAKAASEPPPPSEIETKVRRLQDVEEKVASGNAAAFAEMPRLIHQLSREFAEVGPENWTQARNARALALFLLSGGEPALGRKVLATRDPAPAEPALLKGAVAYLEGVDSPERDALLDLDPRQLDPGLGAQLAFVQSILLASYDRSRAASRLDLARLLAPGGLVEEAALRREIGLASEMHDIDKFASLSRQYWMRFRASPYAENFLRQFAAAAARTAQSIGVAQWAQFDEFMGSLGPERRRLLLLTMARAAAVAGNSAFADLSARRALALAAPGSPEAWRARLYGAMANVGGPQSLDSAALLKAIDRSALPAGDQPLYDAAALAAARLYRPPQQDFSAPPEGAGDLAGGEFARAGSDLAAADAGLESARRSMERKTR